MKKDFSNTLKKHADKCHGEHRFNLDVSILGKCFGKSSHRLITETVMIEELQDDEVMNSRKEWSCTCLCHIIFIIKGYFHR